MGKATGLEIESFWVRIPVWTAASILFTPTRTTTTAPLQTVLFFSPDGGRSSSVYKSHGLYACERWIARGSERVAVSAKFVNFHQC